MGVEIKPCMNSQAKTEEGVIVNKLSGNWEIVVKRLEGQSRGGQTGVGGCVVLMAVREVRKGWRKRPAECVKAVTRACRQCGRDLSFVVQVRKSPAEN